MAGEVTINTSANPAAIPAVGAVAGVGVLHGIIIFDSTLLEGAAGAALAASVPRYTVAIVLSTKQIFITEDNVGWQAYS